MGIHVVGLGPVGLLISHSLRRVLPVSTPVTVIHRTLEGLEKFTMRKNKIEVQRDGVVSQANGLKSELLNPSPNPARQPGQITSLIVALKAHHTLPVIRTLAPRLSANSTVVLLQNGLGVFEEVVEEVFRNERSRPNFILTSNTNGAFKTHPFHAVHAGIGAIDFGIVPDAQGRDFDVGFSTEDSEGPGPKLSDITTDSDPQFERYKSLRETVAALLLVSALNPSWRSFSDLQTLLKRKLVVNSFVNPLTAILGCRNGALLDMTYAGNILQQLCQEAEAVYAKQIEVETASWIQDMAAQGIDTSNISIPPLPRALSAESLQEEALRVTEVTKANISSMLQDVQRGAYTEIDYINGYLMRLGQKYDVPAKVNTTLLDLVKMRTMVPLDRIL